MYDLLDVYEGSVRAHTSTLLLRREPDADGPLMDAGSWWSILGRRPIPGSMVWHTCLMHFTYIVSPVVTYIHI